MIGQHSCAAQSARARRLLLLQLKRLVPKRRDILCDEHHFTLVSPRPYDLRRKFFAAVVEHRIVGLRILTRAIKQENENVGPFDMAQELYAQSFSFMRPLDEARDVGHHKALPHVDAHNPQVGHKGGEWVVGDLRPRRRYDGNEC